MTDLSRTYDVLVVGGGNAGAVRRDHRAPGRRLGADRSSRRRRRSAAATAGTRATCAACTTRPTDVLTGRLSRRGVLGGPAEGDRRRRPTSSSRGYTIRDVRDLRAWMVEQRRALPALARRHAAPVAHQRVLPRRRQGAAERATTARPSSSASRSSTTPRCATSTSSDGRFRLGRPSRTAARSEGQRAKALVAASGGFEVEHRVAARRTGATAADNFLDPRHAVQHGARCCECCSTRAPSRSAIRRSATRWRSTRARRSSTAASSRASTACRSASSSTSTPSASTTRARTSGRSATRSGAGSSPSSPTRSPTRSSTAKAVGTFMPSVFPPVEGRLDRRAGARARARSARRSRTTVDALQRRRAARHVRPRGARRLPTEGLDAAEDALGAADRHAAVLRLSAAARASPSPTSASR